METFDEWVESLGGLAIREMAGGAYELRALPLPEVRALVRCTPWIRRRARESWGVERDSRAWLARQDPWELRDLKIRYGLVD